MGADCRNMFRVKGTKDNINFLKRDFMDIIETDCEDSTLYGDRVKDCDILFYTDTLKEIYENGILYISLETHKGDLLELLEILTEGKEVEIDLCTTNDEADSFRVIKIVNGETKSYNSTEYVYDKEGLDKFLELVDEYLGIPHDRLVWGEIISNIEVYK